MTFARTFLILLISTGTMSACSKDKEGDKGAPAPAKPSESAPAIAAFTGELTAEVIGSANGIVKPFDSWATGFAKLKGKLGEPTLVDGKNHYWGVMSGDSCTFIYVSKDNEAEFFKDKPNPQDMIGTVAEAATTSKDDYEFETCIKAAGVSAESLEDPNAPVPPAEGSVSVIDFRAGQAGAKSKWLGKSITVEGVYISTSTSSSGDQKTTTLSISNEIGGESASCTLSDATQAEGLTQGDAIKVTGTVAEFKGSLDNCSRVVE